MVDLVVWLISKSHIRTLLALGGKPCYLRGMRAILLVCCLLLLSCAGSFGLPGTPTRCAHLTSGERWSGAVAKASLAVSGVSAGLALPTDDRTKRTALAVTALSTAGITAASIFLQDSYRDESDQTCKVELAAKGSK